MKYLQSMTLLAVFVLLSFFVLRIEAVTHGSVRSALNSCSLTSYPSSAIPGFPSIICSTSASFNTTLDSILSNLPTTGNPSYTTGVGGWCCDINGNPLNFWWEALNGPIPANVIGNFTTIQFLDLLNDAGPPNVYTIPSSWTNNIKGISLSLGFSSNWTWAQYWNGIGANAIPNLQYLYASSVYLSSLTGEGFSEMTINYNSLRTLVMPYAYLNGTLPPALFSSSSLTYLDLSHNSLSGSLPSTSPASFAHFTHFDVSFNAMDLCSFDSTTNTSSGPQLPNSLISATATTLNLVLAPQNQNQSCSCIWGNCAFGQWFPGHWGNDAVYLTANQIALCPPVTGGLPRSFEARDYTGESWSLSTTKRSSSIDQCPGTIQCPLPIPGSDFQCVNGVWVSPSTVNVPTLTIPSSTVFINGNLTVGSMGIIISGPAGGLVVSGCAVVNGPIIIVLSSSDIANLTSSSGFHQSLLTQSSSCNTSLASIPIQVYQPPGCNGVTTSTEPSYVQLLVTFKPSNNCKSDIWWIVMTSVAGGVLIIVGVVLVAWKLHRSSTNSDATDMFKSTIQ